MRGTYNPPPVIFKRWEYPRLIQPLVDRFGGMADAIYEPDTAPGAYRLMRVEEWLPPSSPQERARMFTDAAELPPLTQDGRVDFDAMRERRDREWLEHDAAHNG